MVSNTIPLNKILTSFHFLKIAERELERTSGPLSGQVSGN